MKEITNYQKLDFIFQSNNGFITRSDVDDENISSWFLTDYIRKNNLIKVAPGFYASEDYSIDEYFIFQKRYPKYVFSGMSALYIHHLTDKIPQEIEVTRPQGYNPIRNKELNIKIRQISDFELYELGIEEKRTMFGNFVKVYDKERTICDLIKSRDKYDSETFVKALRLFVRSNFNQIKLLKYSKIMKIEAKVFNLMEIFNNEDQ